MANWISIKAAAEKYGATEELIHSLIRLRYIRFSFVDDSALANINNRVLMVDADSINNTLDLHAVKSLAEEQPEDESIVRIPMEDLKELLRINDEYKKLQESLVAEVNIALEKEAKQKELSDKLGELSTQVITLHLNSMQHIKEIIDREDEGIWAFLRKAFSLKKAMK